MTSYGEQEKLHLWISANDRMAGSETLAASPNSEFLVQVVFPQEMPQYSRYTVQVKQFALMGDTGNINSVNRATGAVVANNPVAFIRCAGLPLCYNLETTNSRPGVAGGGQLMENSTLLTRFDTFFADARDQCAIEPLTTPKIVCNRLNGNIQLKVALEDIRGNLLCGTGSALGAITNLPQWFMMLEICGVQGYADEPYRIPPPPPAVVTMGVNTSNQAGFKDDGYTDKKPAFFGI